jgi:hypothetical protein
MRVGRGACDHEVDPAELHARFGLVHRDRTAELALEEPCNLSEDAGCRIEDRRSKIEDLFRRFVSDQPSESIPIDHLAI